MSPSEEYLKWMKEKLNKKEIMTPSQKIGAIADQLLKDNPKLSIHSAYINAIITHMDREKLDAQPTKPVQEASFPNGKHVIVKDGDLKKSMDNQDIKLTIETDGKKLVLDIPWNADIYAWEAKLFILLRWLTFCPDTINLILGSQTQ